MTNAIYLKKLSSILFKQILEKPQKGLLNLPFSKSDFFSVNGSYSAVRNIHSSNPGKGMGADDNNHQLLKCAHKENYRGCSLPWSRMQVKRNKIIIETKRTRITPLGDPQTFILLQTSSCTSRGCVDEALLPTELIRTEWSTTALSWLGLQFAKLE